MTPYVLLIKEQSGVSLQEIERHLKKSYRSEEYLYGFLDGYLFGSYNLLTLVQFETKTQTESNPLNSYHLKIVYVVGDEDE